MNDTQAVAKIEEGIHDLFPESSGIAITRDTLLDDIPGWDSMAAVNLQTFLEEIFKVSVPEEILGGDASIRDIIAHIQGA